MTLRNLPLEEAFELAERITCRRGQVSSMGLTTHGSTCDMTLLAFSEGDSVSEETYGADVLYVALEGEPTIVLPDKRVAIPVGQMLVVSAGVLHAVEGPGAFKILQIAVG